MRALYPRALGPFVLIAPATPWEGEPASLAIAHNGAQSGDDAGNTKPSGAERLVLVAHVPVEQSAEKVRQRFHARFEQLARLQHPGLPSLRESGEAEGELFAARDHIVGRSLAQLQGLVRQEGLSIPTTVAIFVAREVVAALAYLHEFEGLGLVHDTIDAGSVLVSFEGHVTLQGGSYARLIADDGDPADARDDVAAWIAMLREMLGVTPGSLPGVSALSLPDSCLGTLWAALAAEKPAVLPASAWVDLLDRVLASQPGAQAELAALMLLFPEDREREDRQRAVEEARPLLVESESRRAPGEHGAHSSPTVQMHLSTGPLDETGAPTAPMASSPPESSAALALAPGDGAIPQPIPPRRTPWSEDKLAALVPVGPLVSDAPSGFAAHEAAFFAVHDHASAEPPGLAGEWAAVLASAKPPEKPSSLPISVSRVRPSVSRSPSRALSRASSNASARSKPRAKKRARLMVAWLGLAVAGSLSFAVFWWLQPFGKTGSGTSLSLRSGTGVTAVAPATLPVVPPAGPSPEGTINSPPVSSPPLPSPLPTALQAARLPGEDVVRAHFSQARKQPGGPSTRPMRVAPGLSVGRGSEAESLAAVLSRARFAYVNEAFDEAIAGARQALTMGAGAEAHALLGNAYLGKHAYRDAEREYVRTLALDPLDMHARDRLEWVRARRPGGPAGGLPPGSFAKADELGRDLSH